MLRRAVPARRPFAVARVQLIDDVHPRDDLAERRETHPVQLPVVLVADEELGGAGVPTAFREGDATARIRLDDRVVHEKLALPRLADVRVRV